MTHGRFDAYHQWLGIPPAEQPPDHYRLLGVARFERDANVIDAAANRQMAHLRTYQTGPHAELSQRLLNEVAAARVCLLQSQQRAVYDAHLRAQSRPLPAVPVAPVAADTPSAPDLGFVPQETASPAREARRRQNAVIGVLVGTIAVAGFLLLAVIVWLNSSSSKEQADRTDGPPESSETRRSSKNTAKKTLNATGEPKTRKWKFETARGATIETGDVETLDAPPPPPVPEFEGLPPMESRPPARSPTDPAPAAGGVKRPSGKQPAPVAVAQAKAELQVSEAFRDDLAKAANPIQKRDLARRILNRGKEEPETALAYALLDKARSLAVESGEILAALEAIDALGERFDVDPFQLKADALSHFSRSARTPGDLLSIVSESRKAAEAALAANQLEAAERLCDVSLSTGRKFNNPTITKPLVELQKQIRQRREAAPGGAKPIPKNDE